MILREALCRAHEVLYHQTLKTVYKRSVLTGDSARSMMSVEVYKIVYAIKLPKHLYCPCLHVCM